MSNFNHTNFIGLTKIAEFEKSAVFAETDWGEKNPELSLAADMGLSAIPYVGSLASLYDAYNSYKNGSMWGAAGNLALAGLSLIPVPGVAAAAKGTANGIIRGVGNAGRWGKLTRTALAGRNISKPKAISTTVRNMKKGFNDTYKYEKALAKAKARHMSKWEAGARLGVGIAGEAGKYEGANTVLQNKIQKRRDDAAEGWGIFAEGFNPYSVQDGGYKTDGGYYDEYGNPVSLY